MTAKTQIVTASCEDYVKEFEVFQTNVNAAARAYFYHVNINDSARKSQEVLQALNESPRFWLDYRYFSMQSIFIVLGRIFDRDPRSHSVWKLLDKAKSSRYFSKEKLRGRKISGSSNAHEWIDKYMDCAYEFSDQDWEQLKKYVENIKSEWDSKMGEIRNKYFAHEDEFPTEEKQRQFLQQCENTNVESIISNLMIVENVFEQAGLNGKKQDYDYVPQRTKSLAQKEIDKMLGLLTASKPVEFDTFRK